jgi:hypothetical protein
MFENGEVTEMKIAERAEVEKIEGEEKLGE